MRKVKGFTLIELLIVVVILGILATFVIILLGNATNRAKDAKVKDAIKTVQTALSIMSTNRTDLATALGGTSVTLAQGNYTKIVDVDGAFLLSDIPIDAQSQGLHLIVSNTGYYSISGQSSKAGSCWRYTLGGGTSSNLTSSSPSPSFCN